MGGARFSYVKDADRYIIGVMRDLNIVDEYERITPVERASEYVMLGMRTAHGIDGEEYTRLYRSDFTPLQRTLEEFEKKGWACKNGEDRWRFTSSGFLLSNLLIGALLEAQSGSRVAVNPWMKEAFDAEEKTELPPGDEELFRDMYMKGREREQ